MTDEDLGDNPLVIADAIWKWNEEASDFMRDEDFEKVLELVIKLMANDIPEPAKVAAVCVRLSAYSIKFRMGYAAYMSYKKGTKEANMKKNHYKELYTGIDKLVDTLKYLVKV
jgi:hypothetical protein